MRQAYLTAHRKDVGFPTYLKGETCGDCGGENHSSKGCFYTWAGKKFGAPKADFKTIEEWKVAVVEAAKAAGMPK